MLNNVLEFLMASPSFREAFDAQARGVSALYEMAEGQRPFYAALLTEAAHRPVLYVAPSEQAAMRAAEDCAQWLGGGAALLPSPEINFTRGTASRENAFRRLSVLQMAGMGKIRVLCVSAEGLLTRMLPPAEYRRRAVTLNGDSRMEPEELIARLVNMGYERVDMVEGRGQCALRGAIVDAFSPAEGEATRVEFFDNEIDSLRTFDPISQRSRDRLQEVSFYPAVEWLMPAEEAPRMRQMIRSQLNRLPDQPLAPDLPPLPEDEEPQEQEETAYRVYDTGVARLYRDADQLEAGLQPPTLSLWAGALSAPCAWLWEYLENPIVVLEEPDRVKQRCEDRLRGFSEDFKLALERQEAVPEQGALLRAWEEAAQALGEMDVHLLQDLLRGMGGLQPRRVARFAGVNAPRYVSRFKDLSADIAAWSRQAYMTLILSGGEARGRRVQTALEEMGVASRFAQEALTPGTPWILP
ncbi:MAG: hypothetical protein GX637_03695, partial [Clostridiales bacterium]|nr:hypothetical protein [Clostridiales bacterium]